MAKRGTGFRVVESQSRVATNALVNNLEEQRVLEELLEAGKPGHLEPGYHFLIATPFRYPPLKYGSRYGAVHQRGIFYGSEQLATAFAETAFYALVFVQHSEGLDTLSVPKTAFEFFYETTRVLDTSGAEHDGKRAAIDSPDDYSVCQAIGTRAREDGIDVIRFRSVRCPRGGYNLAILHPRALQPKPGNSQSWEMVVRHDRVEFLAHHGVGLSSSFAFLNDDFVTRGVASHPGGDISES